jgi:hypothetical protein
MNLGEMEFRVEDWVYILLGTKRWESFCECGSEVLVP